MDLYYSAIIAISVFTLIVMGVCVSVSGSLPNEKKKHFAMLFLVTAVSAVCEYTGNALQGAAPSLRHLHIFVKALELSMAPFIGYVIANILSAQTMRKPFHVFLCVHALAEWASGFLGFIFFVDENNIYYHADFYWIYITVYLISTIYGLAAMFLSMKKYQYRGSAFMCLIGALLLFGIGIQLALDELNVIWLVVTIIGVLLYIFNAEMIQQTDALTLLINRRGYETYLSHIQEPVVIACFDVDQFKQVNDTYGHAYGDQCLKTVGTVLHEVYARSGKCFRIGGDEFCVILTKDADKIDILNSQFFHKLNGTREHEAHLPYVSVGYVHFDPKNNSIEDAVKEADEMMYRYKFAHRERNVQ